MEDRLGARFLIPMATSLAFGVLFATAISLFLLPSAYLVLEDLKGLGRRGRAGGARLGVVRGRDSAEGGPRAA